MGTISATCTQAKYAGAEPARRRHEHAGQAGGSRRVLGSFLAQAGSVKVALSGPAHQYPEGA